MPATYINHYAANGGVVVPQFGGVSPRLFMTLQAALAETVALVNQRAVSTPALNIAAGVTFCTMCNLMQCSCQVEKKHALYNITLLQLSARALRALMGAPPCRHCCGDRQAGHRDAAGGVWGGLQGGGRALAGGAAERRQHPLHHAAVGQGRLKPGACICQGRRWPLRLRRGSPGAGSTMWLHQAGSVAERR